MSEWVKSKAKLLLLITALVLLILIMAQLALHSGILNDPRNAEVSFSSYGSNDSPTSYQYFLVEGIDPSGTNIKWKDVRVMTKDPCTDVHLDTTKDPPVYVCPKYVTVVEGKDYTIDDKDENGRVSKGDSVKFDLKRSNSWDKDIAFKWKVTGDIIYQDRLPLT